jgi:hypothetical protein
MTDSGAVSLKEILDRGDQFPVGLSSLYDIYLERVYKTPEKFQEFGSLILGLLAVARTELTQKEIIDGLKDLRLSRVRLNQELKNLGSLVKSTQDGICLEHKSVGDWLISEANSRWTIDAVEARRRLVKLWLPVMHCKYVVDEIERSIHPIMIKDIIRKLSESETAKGQLIFTTHESGLLDQSIFRPDEIWFAQKDAEQATQLYPLSDYNIHKTANIENGYLNGRYGGIPFLSNLKDLHW